MQAVRKKVLANFEDLDDRPFLLVNIKSGSVGIDIRCAAGIIFATCTWSAVDHQQAIARAWRANQKRDVRVVFFRPLVSSGNGGLDTVESHMYDTVAKKRDVADLMYTCLFGGLPEGQVAAELPVDVDGRKQKEVQETTDMMAHILSVHSINRGNA